MKRDALIGNSLLFIAALIWGCAFVAQSMGMEFMGPFTFQAVRSFIGVAVLMPAIALRNAWNRKRGNHVRPSRANKKDLLLGGLACGTLLTIAANLQQFALQYTTAGKAGFLTALYILLVPVAGMFAGRKPSPLIWLCILFAAFGLWLLSVKDGFSIALPDLLLILCALVFTGHILLVDHFSPKVSGLQLSSLQFLVAGVLSSILMLAFEQPKWQGIVSGWAPILYAGALSSGVAYTLQILGQRRTSPTISSLIMSLESVFALLAGMLILGEQPSLRELAGCAIMMAAIILAQWAQLPKRIAEGVVHENI